MASGDNSNRSSPRYTKDDNFEVNDPDPELDSCKITPQLIDEKEIKMKERIAQCKNIIESLKVQLTEEKEKMKNDKQVKLAESPKSVAGYYGGLPNIDQISEDHGNSSMYSASVDSKLNCDDNLIQYEKQLQKYQNTLTMAQNEKKNAIRKQMLAKAFKLKLMEVENQCNIELLRVKQSMQCLEPLQMIVDKWKTDREDSIYDINTLELIPNFPELHAGSGVDVNAYKDEFDIKNLSDAVLKGESAHTEY